MSIRILYVSERVERGFVYPQCIQFSVARHLYERRPQTAVRTNYIFIVLFVPFPTILYRHTVKADFYHFALDTPKKTQKQGLASFSSFVFTIRSRFEICAPFCIVTREETLGYFSFGCKIYITDGL